MRPSVLSDMMSCVFQMISVERVMGYLDLEKEAPWEYKDRPSPPWSNEGRIRFDTVNFRHTLDGPLVLKNLTAVIKSRKKVCSK